MSQQALPEASAGPKKWQCGDPFQYPLPHPVGDPWEVILEPYLTKDKIRCETWKDEVQTLLIFAGLFSAVVASFVVESVQTLQDDPTDTLATLLAQIAYRLDNGTSPPSTIPFSPAASSIRINILWFLSLILSLSTVLVGIVALQWLREHQRYTDGITPKECVAVYHMREEALERWCVPQIFTGLPLLLQVALVLFLVGTADFLCALNLAVGIPVSVLIAVSLFFLAATTTLPTLQLFLLALRKPSRVSMKIPPQCAYKSPQSWAMQRLFTLLFSLGSSIHKRSPFPKPNSWDLRWIPLRFGLYNDQESWITFDSRWLRIRNCYSIFEHEIELHTSRQYLDELAPQYDVSEMLKNTVQMYTGDANTILATYQCFQMVSRDAVLNSQSNIHLLHDMGHNRRMQLFRCQYWHQWDRPLTIHPRPMDLLGLQVIHEEHLAFFLWSPSRLYPEALSGKIGAHILELRCRILHYEFIHNRFRNLEKYQKSLLNHIYEYYRHSLHKVSVGPSRGLIQHISVPDEIVDISVEQLFSFLQSFFEVVDSEYEAWFIQQSQRDEYSVRSLKGFLETSPLLLDRFSQSSTCDTVFKSIFHAIVSRTDSPEQNDFMFFAATHFLYELLPAGNTHLGSRINNEVATVIRSLSCYERRLQLAQHQWIVREPFLWSRNYLWEDPNQYRIGTWSKIYEKYEDQDPGGNIFSIALTSINSVGQPSNQLGATDQENSLSNFQMENHSQTDAQSTQLQSSVHSHFVPEAVHLDPPIMTLNETLLVQGQRSPTHSMQSNHSLSPSRGSEDSIS